MGDPNPRQEKVVEIRARIETELETLSRQSQQLDESYKSAKLSLEARIELLGRLLPRVTPEIEALIKALNITI